MMRSKRFEPIKELASNAAKDLSRSMGEAAKRVAELERQFEQLQTFRSEYVNKSTVAGGAMDAVKLQNFRSFVDRLGEAIRQHVTKLDAARVEYDRRRQVWSEKRVQAESLGRAIERFRKDEQHTADRREQRDSDEAAMRITARAESANRQ
jgi:flagellar protein FliJ